jgi:hypothetical protein
MSMPAGARQARATAAQRRADALVAGHAGKDRRGRALRAVAGHLTGYWMWRSPEVDQGLAPDEAVDVAVRLLLAAGS